MKKIIPCVLLLAGAGLMQASIIETISFNLSALHPGSTLSGSFTLPDAPMIGDSELVMLSFSDPSDYRSMTLETTVSITNGTFGDAIRFSPILFTNIGGTPRTTRIDLMVAGAAQCTSFPCSATGRFADGDPANFVGAYTIAPGAAVPEPSFLLMIPVLLAGFAIARRNV